MMEGYSSESPFNQPMEVDAEIDPKSAGYIKTVKKTSPLLVNLKQYSSPTKICVIPEVCGFHIFPHAFRFAFKSLKSLRERISEKEISYES